LQLEKTTILLENLLKKHFKKLVVDIVFKNQGVDEIGFANKVSNDTIIQNLSNNVKEGDILV
jgi:hypothetical protein